MAGHHSALSLLVSPDPFEETSYRQAVSVENPRHGLPDRPPPSTQPFWGIINPTCNYPYGFSPSNGLCYAVLVLPRGDLGPAGLRGTLADTGLLRDKPNCYRSDPDPTKIEWAPGFEDGGAAVQNRMFPVYVFGENRYCWAPARNLSPFIPCPRMKNSAEAMAHLTVVKGMPVLEQWLETCRNGLSGSK